MRSISLVLLAMVMVACRGEQSAQSGQSDAQQPATESLANREEILSLQRDPGLGGSPDGQENAFQKHLALTSKRPPTHEDSVRARELSSQIKKALAKYSDTTVARAEGYRPYVRVPGSHEIHFFNTSVWLDSLLDPAKPSALLYLQDTTGSLTLTGAMYSVPARTTAEELEKMTPLSIVYWHRHANWCIPPLDQQERWTEKEHGRYVFGQMGYTTKADCDRVKGLFRTDLAGWMMHAYPFASDDLAGIWGGAQMEMGSMGGHEH